MFKLTAAKVSDQYYHSVIGTLIFCNRTANEAVKEWKWKLHGNIIFCLYGYATFLNNTDTFS